MHLAAALRVRLLSIPPDTFLHGHPLVLGAALPPSLEVGSGEANAVAVAALALLVLAIVLGRRLRAERARAAGARAEMEEATRAGDSARRQADTARSSADVARSEAEQGHAFRSFVRELLGQSSDV